MLKLIKYHPLFAYSVGDVFEVNEADTKSLLDGEYAVSADGEEPQPEKEKIETPEANMDQPENASQEFKKPKKQKIQ